MAAGQWILGSKGFFSVDLKKDELEKLLRFHKKVLENVRWVARKDNPFQRIQDYMLFSTKDKFKQEGISKQGRTKWWGKWTEKYSEFRIKIMKQPTPILQLDGTYRSGAGKVYIYNRRLIRSIKKRGPNSQGVMLATNCRYAWVHQKGTQGGPTRFGRGRVSGRARKSGLRDRIKKTARRIKNIIRRKMFRSGAKSRNRGGIPRRPYFIWINRDITYVNTVFHSFWLQHFTKGGIGLDMVLPGGIAGGTVIQMMNPFIGI